MLSLTTAMHIKLKVINNGDSWCCCSGNHMIMFFLLINLIITVNRNGLWPYNIKLTASYIDLRSAYSCPNALSLPTSTLEPPAVPKHNNTGVAVV